MRFLNTETLRFEEVADSKLGAEENKYAILSHRWGATEDEVSFADIHESKDFSHKKGFAKLEGFCDMAASLGYRYGWDDTCCINKGDSSEFTEAINSMYRWYQGSHICIVYLEDVPEKRMMESEWFDRGWTLQELIGPKAASFYNHDWNLIGTKIELLAELSSKTGIPEDVLSHATSPSACSVAQRMSWAAKRNTTRDEDRAYSLLGLFGVSMPQIYGEREKAFLRLQRAIIQQSKDESIFAWPMGTGKEKKTYTGLFALSPSSYVDCSDVIITRGSTGFSETNGELSINLRTLPHSMETYSAVLNCTKRAFPEDRIAILVTRLSTENEYVRVNKTYAGGKTLIPPPKLELLKERLIRVSLDPTEPPLNRVYGFWLRTLEPPGHTGCQTRVLSKSNQSETDKVCLGETDRGTAGIIYMEPKIKPDHTHGAHQSGWSKIRWIKLGFDEDFNPILFLANDMAQSPVMNPRAPLVKPNEELFKQVFTSEAGSQARNEIFNNRWINSPAGVPSRSRGWDRGISVLQVDRTKGISGSLEALNLGISVNLVPDLSPDMMSKESTDESSRQIWVVDITDTGGSDPERDLEHVSRDEDMAAFCACCFGGGTQKMDAVASERGDARRLTKVLGASDLKKLH